MTRQRCAVALEPQHREHAPRTDRRHRRLATPARRAGSGTAAAAGRRGRCGSRRHGACWRRRARGRPRVPASSRVSGLKGGRPQFCPCGPSGSGGAPTETLGAKRSGRAQIRSRRDRRPPRDRGRGRCSCPAARARSAACRAGGPRAIAARHGRRHAPRDRAEAPDRRRSGRSRIRLRPFAEPGRPRRRKCSDSASKVAWASSASPPSRRKASKASGRRVAWKSTHSASSSGPLDAHTPRVVDELRSCSAAQRALRVRVRRGGAALALAESPRPPSGR